jgi:hypothetical protein
MYFSNAGDAYHKNHHSSMVKGRAGNNFRSRSFAGRRNGRKTRLCPAWKDKTAAREEGLCHGLGKSNPQTKKPDAGNDWRTCRQDRPIPQEGRG